ncbi:MAG: alkaline phosphatase family protein [Anaerolineales bacterium]
MPDLTSSILPRIDDHHIENLPLDDGLIFPFYEGFSLVNIPGTLARLLDASDFGKPPLDEVLLSNLKGPYEKVILMLVDALGYHLFNEIRCSEKDSLWCRYADQAVFCPITSICPSTTASALTSLWTGEGAARHGIVGYTMWAKEFGMVINNIHHSAASANYDTGGLSRSGFDPQAFLDAPLLGSHLRDHGIEVSAFMHRSIANSGLSVMQLEDVSVMTFTDEADLCVSLAEYMNSRPGIREYIYVYYSDVDTLMHHYSSQDARIKLQFSFFSALFERACLQNLTETAAQKSLLILTADHGSMTTPKNPRYDLANHHDLMDCLVMQPTCENRFSFFFIKPGRVQDLKDYFKRTWPDEFYLLDPDDALDAGLFGNGPFKVGIRDRLGDMIAVARDDAYLWWAPKPNPLAGRHGGLSRNEMLVPFYALPLKNI